MFINVLQIFETYLLHLIKLNVYNANINLIMLI